MRARRYLFQSFSSRRTEVLTFQTLSPAQLEEPNLDDYKQKMYSTVFGWATELCCELVRTQTLWFVLQIP